MEVTTKIRVWGVSSTKINLHKHKMEIGNDIKHSDKVSIKFGDAIVLVDVEELKKALENATRE